MKLTMDKKPRTVKEYLKDQTMVIEKNSILKVDELATLVPHAIPATAKPLFVAAPK
ncbi:MAG: hypothetical protein WC344_02235 [Bacilli bacterium]|jgi:hypothetical protein